MKTTENEACGEGKRQHVAHLPRHVRQPLRLLPCPGLLDHGRGDVDAGHMAGNLGDDTGNESWPAGDI